MIKKLDSHRRTQTSTDTQRHSIYAYIHIDECRHMHGQAVTDWELKNRVAWVRRERGRDPNKDITWSWIFISRRWTDFVADEVQHRRLLPFHTNRFLFRGKQISRQQVQGLQVLCMFLHLHHRPKWTHEWYSWPSQSSGIYADWCYCCHCFPIDC